MKATLERIAKEMSGTVSVGFFPGATYPDGESVANVAAINEYGGRNTPARPF
ncbi:MAG: hypothetical protein RLY82_1804, partial [Pseudomonadota bacterium]